MNPVPATQNRIGEMTAQAVSNCRDLEAALRHLPQVDIPTDHVIHGGMYARTIFIPAGVVLTGVLIRVPTMLIFNGHATVNAGDEPVTLTGYHVLAASAGRRQAFLAHGDTWLTMIFATKAATVAEAEDEFTNEAHLLLSRNADAQNQVTITGE